MDSYNHSEMVGSSSLSQSSIVNYGYFAFEDLLEPAPVTLETGINLSKTLSTSQPPQLHQQAFNAPASSQIQNLDQQGSSNSAQNQPMQLTSNFLSNLDKGTDINPDDPDTESSVKDSSPKLVSSRSSLRKSTSDSQTNKEKRMCPHCGKYLTDVPRNVAEHMRIHTGEKPFICSECGASFAARANFKAHIRFHTGEKPYMCGICGKTFAQSSHMRVHMRKHTGERPYECSDCKRKYSTKTSLRNHMKIHKGELSYKCEQCGRGFVCNSWLQDHYKVHSKNKPFQCEKCGKKYKDKSYVLKHKAQFCGNDGYKKRWKVPGVVKPKGRPPTVRKANSKLTNSKKAATPLKRGRKPKRKRTRSHRTSVQDIDSILDEDADKEADIDTKQISPLPISEKKVKEVNDHDSINLTSNSKEEFQKQKEDLPIYLGSTSNHISYNACQVNVLESNPVPYLQHQHTDNLMDSYKPESGSHDFSLDLDLNDQNDILNCTQPENLSLHNFTQQPQNLSNQESNVTSQHNHVVSNFASNNSPQNLSHSHSSSIHIKFSQSQSTNFHSGSHMKYLSNLSRFSEPQNLSNSQHSSFNSVLSQPQSLPQNLSLHQNITHPLMDNQHIIAHQHKLEAENILNLTTLQPENLTVPQNLSMTENVCQPQNLSLSQHISQPQNLSQNHSFSGSGNFSQTHKFLEPENLSRAMNFSHTHNLPQAHNFSQPQNLSLMSNNISNEEANNTQPQNLSIMSNITENSKNLISSQPQNLSYSDSISRTLISLPQNLSEPQNLSLSHTIQQPQNLSQSHLSVSLSDHFRDLDVDGTGQTLQMDEYY